MVQDTPSDFLLKFQGGAIFLSTPRHLLNISITMHGACLPIRLEFSLPGLDPGLSRS